MIDTIIRNALLPLVSEVAPNRYTGNSLEYATWTYSEIPDDFADDDPNHIRYLVTVNWCFPHGQNPAKKHQIANALKNAGMTYPSITNASDDDGQNYAFQSEWAGGVIDGEA